jgi:hypothetical protein
LQGAPGASAGLESDTPIDSRRPLREYCAQDSEEDETKQNKK